VPAAESITTALLRERLAHTRAPADPAVVVMPAGIERMPTFIRERMRPPLSPAGVLIPLLERAATLSVLLTQRAEDLKHHAGQISFPGGRMEPDDRDVVHAALRETHEEVGIAPESVTIIGYLDTVPTVTGYAVTPVVGLVGEDVSLRLDRTEVDYAFEVPLDFLFDERNQRSCEREHEGVKIPTVEFHYEGRRIWGATAHMLVQFRKSVIKY
jgi:8-oxo-dGTP pyrophosphatase MutT (NUDIX family)